MNKKSLRIAMTADPELAIPCQYNGGIERIVDILVRGLTERGHRVTLFANPKSSVPCELIGYTGLKSRSNISTLKNISLIRGKMNQERYDLIHSHGRLAYLIGLFSSPIPKLMTYHRPISPRSVQLGRLLFGKSIHFTAVGKHMTRDLSNASEWTTIHNGVPISTYDYRAEVKQDAPLVFLGRVEHLKGTHLAIQIAKLAGKKLRIAGNIPPEHQSYFDSQIAPHIDNDSVTYVGVVDDVQKNELLGGAAALLMPILQHEAFGIVMAEALACGTPVIAFNWGSVPEIIRHGTNGYICDNVQAAARWAGQIQSISRQACRADFELRFSDRVMIDKYEDLYYSLSSGHDYT